MMLMKKTIVSCLILASSLMFTVSCNDEPNVAEAPKEEVALDDVLPYDADFQQMQNLIDENTTLIKNALVKNNISLDELRGYYLNGDEEKLAEIFSEVGGKISDNLNSINVQFHTLETKYPTFGESVECSPLANMTKSDARLALADIHESTFISDANDRYYRCGWRYYVCLGSIGLPAAACFVGSGGIIGAACLAGYGLGAILCADSYCTRI